MRVDAVGITSVCSAHPVVLDEAVRHGAQGEHVVLIEATCNQVNQDGGYTGMQPIDFRRAVERLAEEHELPAERLVLGGDHLGPNPWKHLSAETAMAKSAELVRAFVMAGYTKIHLDTSIRCADDPPGAMHPALVAERAARLAVVAEEAAAEAGLEPRYVIGTEVPVPGGGVGRRARHPRDDHGRRRGDDRPHPGRVRVCRVSATRGSGFGPSSRSRAWSSPTRSCSATCPGRRRTCPGSSAPSRRWSSRRTAPTTRPRRRCAGSCGTGSRSSRSGPG